MTNFYFLFPKWKFANYYFKEQIFWFLKYYCVLNNEKLHTSHSNNLIKANIMIIDIFPIHFY